jgi:hypothetical protein
MIEGAWSRLSLMFEPAEVLHATLMFRQRSWCLVWDCLVAMTICIRIQETIEVTTEVWGDESDDVRCWRGFSLTDLTRVDRQI